MEKRDNLQIPRSEKKGEKEVLQVPEQLLLHPTEVLGKTTVEQVF